MPIFGWRAVQWRIPGAISSIGATIPGPGRALRGERLAARAGHLAARPPFCKKSCNVQEIPLIERRCQRRVAAPPGVASGGPYAAVVPRGRIARPNRNAAGGA
jgi:hypothetical protein